MDILQILNLGKVMPVIVMNDAQLAKPLGEALLEGGIRTAEITLRTDNALASIEAMARDCPDITVGAGTILSAEQAKSAADAGASFAVSPGATPRLITGCAEARLPLLPGVASVSEMLVLAEQGFSAMKFFPATAAGGIEFLQALFSPLPHLQFCPTGGISVEAAADWLELPNVPCLGGSWVAPGPLIIEGDFAMITRNARRASAL